MGKKKEINYFEELEGLVKTSALSAKYMAKALKEFDGEIGPVQIREAHSIEHDGDLQKHDLMNYLLREFITPIDREDIVSIAEQIDDVTDATEDVLIKLYMFHITSLRPECLTFCDLIIRCCEALREVVREFRKFKKPSKLRELMIEVNRLEEEGDLLYTQSVRNLHVTSKDPVELMVWTDIFKQMEACLDKMEDVTDSIEMVLMKNS